MIKKDNFTGVKAIVQIPNFKVFAIAFLAFAAFIITGCSAVKTANNDPAGNPNSDETVATVNGKAIKLQEVERVIKQQGQGQETKLSPLELAQARLQVLEGLIQQEVMYQKAEKEGVVLSDEDVTGELNKRKTASGLSQEEFDKRLKEAGETETSLRETVKKSLAIQRLTDKITSKVEPPKDSEINDFYAGNKEAFIKKKGVKLAGIVIDPANSGADDATKNDVDALRVANEVINQIRQNPDSFTQIASEKSEDQSRLRGGDLGYLSEDELRQSFSPQIAASLMDAKTPIGQPFGVQAQGKYFILKIQERSDKDENLTLESPGIRQQVTDSLINARKQLLASSYQAIAMNEAKIENLLAQKVVSNPNELSGARPASADTPLPDTNANVMNNNAANTNANPNANAPSNVKPNTNNKANGNKAK